MSDEERERKIREATARLGALFDEIDEQTRLPGEPSLRQVVAEHARERLAGMRREQPS